MTDLTDHEFHWKLEFDKLIQQKPDSMRLFADFDAFEMEMAKVYLLTSDCTLLTLSEYDITELRKTCMNKIALGDKVACLKEVRARTGEGLKMAKTSLDQTDWNVDAAVKWLDEYEQTTEWVTKNG